TQRAFNCRSRNPKLIHCIIDPWVFSCLSKSICEEGCNPESGTLTSSCPPLIGCLQCLSPLLRIFTIRIGFPALCCFLSAFSSHGGHCFAFALANASGGASSQARVGVSLRDITPFASCRGLAVTHRRLFAVSARSTFLFCHVIGLLV